eukprot:jgi/Bigna1/89529/estExt_fgenesh1_pg.C_510028
MSLRDRAQAGESEATSASTSGPTETGATLPHPVTSKALKRAGNENYHVGAAEMHGIIKEHRLIYHGLPHRSTDAGSLRTGLYKIVCGTGWRIHMEDAMTIRLKLSEKHRNLSMFGVYDGHRGSKCSKFLEDHLPNVIGNLKDPTSKKELVVVKYHPMLLPLEESIGCRINRMTCFFVQTDALVQFDQKFLKHQDIRLDGSTCVFALCQPLGGAEGAKKGYKVTVCNVGDSRALIVRSNGRMVPLTMDHKPENSVERRRIYMAGGFVKQNRVDGQLALSRAFGDWSYKNNSALSYHEQKVIAVPDVTNEIMYEGDTLLVCCDGLFEQLSREAVAKFVHQSLQKDRRRDPAAVGACHS